MPSDEAIRVFYAIVPPPPVREALGVLARTVGARVHGRVVSADNVHLTLAFVGAWPAAQLATLRSAADAVRGEPFRLTLDTLGTFRRAGTAWVAPSHPAPQLVTLATTLGDALRAGNVTYDARVFRPHVTLVRRTRLPLTRDTVDPIAWDVDAFTLMESQPRPEGVRYEPLATWSLRAA